MKEEPDGVKHEPPGDKDPPTSLQLQSEKTSSLTQEKKQTTEGGGSESNDVRVKTEPSEETEPPGEVEGSNSGQQSETAERGAPKKKEKSKQKTHKTGSRSLPGTDRSLEDSSHVPDSGDQTSERKANGSKAESSAKPEGGQTETKAGSVPGDADAKDENLTSKDAKIDVSTKAEVSDSVVDDAKEKESHAGEKADKCAPESKESMEGDTSGPSASVCKSIEDHQSDVSQRQADCAEDIEQNEKDKLSAKSSLTDCRKNAGDSVSNDTVISDAKLSAPASSGSSEIGPNNSLENKDGSRKDGDAQVLDKADQGSSSDRASRSGEDSKVGDLAPQSPEEDVAASKQSSQGETSGKDPVTTGETCTESEEMETLEKVDSQKVEEKPEDKEASESCVGKEPSNSVPEETPALESFTKYTEQMRPAVEEKKKTAASSEMPGAERPAETTAESPAGEGMESQKLVDSGKKPVSESSVETDKNGDLGKSSALQVDPVNRPSDSQKSSSEAGKPHNQEKLTKTDSPAASEISAASSEGKDTKSMDISCEDGAKPETGSEKSNDQNNTKEKGEPGKHQAKGEGVSHEQKEDPRCSSRISQEKEEAGPVSVADSEKSSESGKDAPKDDAVCVSAKNAQKVLEDNSAVEEDSEKGIKSAPISDKEALEDSTTGDSLTEDSKSKTEKPSAAQKVETQGDAQPEHSVASKSSVVEDSDPAERSEDVCEEKQRDSNQPGREAGETEPGPSESASSTDSPSSKVKVPAEPPEADDVTKSVASDMETCMDTAVAGQVGEDTKDAKVEKMEVDEGGPKDADAAEKEKETPKSRPSRTRRGRKADKAEETKDACDDNNLDGGNQKEDKAAAKKSTPQKTAESTPQKTAETLVNGHTEDVEGKEKETEEQDDSKDTKTPRAAPRRGRGGSRRRGRGGRKGSRVTKRPAPQKDSEETNSEPAEKRARSGGVKRGGAAVRGRRNGKSATQGDEVENSSDSDAPLVNNKGRGQKTTARGGGAKKACAKPKQPSINNGEEKNDSSSSDDLPLSKAAKVSEI